MINKLFHNVFVYGIAGIVSRGSTWILLPIYAKVLSPAEFGALDLLLTMAALVNLTVALEISQGVSRYWNEADGLLEHCLLASTSLWFSILMYSLFTVVCLVFSKPINYWLLSDPKYEHAMRMSLIYIGLNGVYQVMINQFRWELKTKAYSFTTILHSVVTLFLSVMVLVFSKKGLIWILLAQLISTGIALIISGWMLRGRYIFKVDFIKLKKLLRFSAPLVPAGLAVFVSLYISRFFIKNNEGLEGVAYFAFATKIASLVMLLIFALQIALMPLIYRYHQERKTPNQIAKLFGWFVSVSSVGCLILSLFSRELVLFFGSADFMVSANLISVMAPALLISQMYIFAPGISISKKTFLQLGVAVIGSSVSIFGNWLLVPKLGLWGASISTLASAVTYLSLWVYCSQKYYFISYPLKRTFKAIVVYISMLLLAQYVEGLNISFYLAVSIKLFMVIVLSIFLIKIGLTKMRDIRYLSIWLIRKLQL